MASCRVKAACRPHDSCRAARRTVLCWERWPAGPREGHAATKRASAGCRHGRGCCGAFAALPAAPTLLTRLQNVLQTALDRPLCRPPPPPPHPLALCSTLDHLLVSSPDSIVLTGDLSYADGYQPRWWGGAGGWGWLVGAGDAVAAQQAPFHVCLARIYASADAKLAVQAGLGPLALDCAWRRARPTLCG